MDTTEELLFIGIRPEDVHDSQAFISNSPDSVIESTIKVYELLGAEVYLYFDLEGTQMTARVNPRTTLRNGDHAVFALDMEKDPHLRQRNRVDDYKLMF